MEEGKGGLTGAASDLGTSVKGRAGWKRLVRSSGSSFDPRFLLRGNHVLNMQCLDVFVGWEILSF